MAFWTGIGCLVVVIIALVYIAYKMPICRQCLGEKWACNCSPLD